MKFLGVLIPDKKSQKLNWPELAKTCNEYGFHLVKLNRDKSLEEQEKISVFLHKLTDILVEAIQGDAKACTTINNVEQYLSNHPEITVIDPLDNVRLLLNRNIYYTILDEELSCERHGIYTPSFAEFTTNDIEDNIQILKSRGVSFPLICKSTIAQGSKMAHQMMLIFNERGLKHCRAPCVLQSFVNHNAVLHKVFVVGNRYHVCERPSLKNYSASDDLEPIFFTTGEVCKADSQSSLSILDRHEQSPVKRTLDDDKVQQIIEVLRLRIGLLLFGFDVVIDNVNGNHAVIDINVFPSYDIFPNFFTHLLECIQERVLNGNLLDNSFSRENKNLHSVVNVANELNEACVKGMNI